VEENKDLNSEQDEKDLQLGGNITLSGFKEIGRGEIIVVKKIVGSYARKFSDNIDNFESLKLNLKIVHQTEASEKYELHCQAIAGGKSYNTDHTDRNLFVCLDHVLKNAYTLASKE
jgi:hypothetical protein